MRLTITLDDDLYAMARSHAIATKTSISKAISDLLKRTTAAASVAPMATGDKSSYFDPILGFQVSRSDSPITNQDIQDSIADEDLRHLEPAGWDTKEHSQP